MTDSQNMCLHPHCRYLNSILTLTGLHPHSSWMWYIVLFVPAQQWSPVHKYTSSLSEHAWICACTCTCGAVPLLVKELLEFTRPYLPTCIVTLCMKHSLYIYVSCLAMVSCSYHGLSFFQTQLLCYVHCMCISMYIHVQCTLCCCELNMEAKQK